MKNGQARILFATYQLAKEGLDIPGWTGWCWQRPPATR